MGSINSLHRRRRMSSGLDVNTTHQEGLGAGAEQRRRGDSESHEGGDETGGEIATGTNDSDSEHTDLSSILAYLIRSGQVRILSNRSDDRDDSFSEDDEFYGPTRPPVGTNLCTDPHPDTTKIRENDIHEEILRQSGRSRAFDKSQQTVTHMVYKRQTGMSSRAKFEGHHRRVLTTPFLPNYCDMVASYRQKAFCGTYSTDGNIFLSAAQDQNIRVYDTKDGKFELLKSIRAKDVGWSVLDTAFSPDGNYMVYSSWSECIHLCNIHGDDDIHTALHLFPSESSFCIFSLTFSSDNREILGGSNDGNLYVYDRDSNQRCLRIDAHDDDVNAVAFADSTSQILFSGGDDGLCKIWDRRTLREEHPIPVGTLAGHHDGITYIDSKGDARYLLSNSKDQCIKLWDIRVMSNTKAVEKTKKAVSKQRWDYRWQQVPRKMCQSRILDGDTSVMTYRGHSVLHTLIRCHFSPQFSTGQRYVYSGCATGSLVIYDTLTGNIVRRLEGHRQCVRDVSWHPYENNIVTTSWDGSLKRWEYRSLDKFDEEQEEEEESSSSDGDDGGGTFRIRRTRRAQKREKSAKKMRKEPCCTFKGLFD